MNKIFKAVASLSMIAVTALLMGSCSSDPDSAGHEYMPDMYRSPAIEPYVDYGEVRGKINEKYKMEQSALVPPSSTIPYYGTNEEEVLMMLPYHRKPSPAYASTHGLFGWDFTTNTEPDYEYNQAANDKNPLKLTPENAEKMFADGKTLYSANCMHCHGEKGDGNGPMVQSGAYTGVPNYADKAMLGDGQIFYSIYYGKGMMGSHASLLNKKEIWTLVHYVRKFQNPAYGTADAAAPADTLKTVMTASAPAPAAPVKKP